MISTRPVVAGRARIVALCLLAFSVLAATTAAAQQGGASSDGTATGWGAATVVKPTSPPKRRPAQSAPANETAKSPDSLDRPSAGVAPAPTGRRAALSKSHAPAVLRIVTTGDRTAGRIAIELTASVPVAARPIANPPRIIVDLPETTFRIPPEAGQTAKGLVAGFRFGLIEAGKSRIVFDTQGPVDVVKAEIKGPLAQGRWQLLIDLEPTTASKLAAREKADVAGALKPSIVAAPPPPRPGTTRPVIVVDAGHGGIDPGATGTKFKEKDVVLAVARQLRRRLITTARYDVVMTRASDVFISLDDRVDVSRRTQADLFVSIHADSLPASENTASVRGATIYTLSDRASDAFAARMAEKENAVDLLAGLSATTTSNDDVRAILVDLMRRETATFSSAFRDVLVKSLRPHIRLAGDPYRSGPFKVLKQAGSPSVLVELGYMSNPTDERLMVTAGWQQKVAEAIVQAIDQYFATHQHGQR